MLDIDKYRLTSKDLKPPRFFKQDKFKSTKDIEPNKEIIGQKRAIEAIEFGLKMNRKGYNIYVSGTSGTGRSSNTYNLINKYASKKELKDWVYVNNFNNTNEPIALSLPSGEGKVFKKEIEQIISKLKSEVPVVFNSKEYEQHNRILITELESTIQSIVEELNRYSKPRGFTFQISERGLVSVPIKEDGTPMNEEELGKLTTVEIQKIRKEGMKLNQDSVEFINSIKNSENKYQDKLKELEKSVGKSIVGFYGSYLLKKYKDSEKISMYINDLCNDIVDNISKFKSDEESKQNPMAMLGLNINKKDEKEFSKYKVNLLIDSSEFNDNRIVIENNPTYYNLIGCVEYKNEIGALTTSFMEIKPGSLHKANGGYLIINVKDLLSNPFAWDGLKRALKTQQIAIESLNKQYGYLVTSTLKPEPIDLDIKVVLIGDAYFYSILYAYEEDFRNLFKIMADFDIEIDRNEENIDKITRLIASKCDEENIKHFEIEAVERILEYSTRISDDKDKLTARFNKIIDIIYEANELSPEADEFVREEYVNKAIELRKYRNNKYEEKLNEMFEDGTLLIDIDGEKVGQINGLAVMGTGEYSFGKPSKITASTYRGKRGVINIEREIKQSGSIHDKGVLILSGYLGERYGKEKSLSITTSITFEQNYNGVDGDSASSTELYAIISSIANIPIKQYIAVTGSVSQKGEIQPIGGINEKIEGYFDVCKIKGLTGKQGVMMPIQNVKNLILKKEVIEAVEKGIFNIYAISNIEEGIQILTGESIEDINLKVNKNLEIFRKEENEDKKENKK